MGNHHAGHGHEMFRDRIHAGRVLAEELSRHSLRAPVVLGLARGGVPVAVEVAAALGAPVRAGVARKIGAPGQPELALGAVAADGPPVYDHRLLRAFDLDEDRLHQQCERERHRARQQEHQYGQDPLPELAGRDVIVVDDGLATGATARAAIRRVRGVGPARVVLAVPVGAPDGLTALRREADLVVCPRRPADFSAVGQWYRDFSPVTDDRVRELLATPTR
ncbi:phosphoribosyltransferase [Actinopolyspora mortivallis]|uniref:Phosphoribosyltransferase n=1 Tax=Actinopolyspora mortivallis TaxID=33906 RepID=A0A2T0GRB9_ACTMO|nr:phosphoribosyltransferase family protein [Actinopolyspora mortivallis]PRW61655.1 phosphoribosyltransferase [Actinopolyspora mortivallis]